MSNKPYSPDPHAHPGLHVIALLEAVKGTLALLAATGLEILGPLPLQNAVSTMIRRFNLDPEHGALPSLLKTISPDAVHLAAAAMLAYGLLHIVEAWGLWRAKAWASVLGCQRPFIYPSISTPSSAIPAGPPGACWRSICLWSACLRAICSDVAEQTLPVCGYFIRRRPRRSTFSPRKLTVNATHRFRVANNM